MKTYDIGVIGAGSGGLVAALTAQRRGARVALLERHKIGGECTHSGCVPSKALISSARLYQSLKQTARHGLPVVEATGFDFARVMEHVDEVVQGIYANEQPAHFQKLGIDVYLDPGGAAFLNQHEIQIGPEVIWADQTVIATGSSPRMAPHASGSALEFLTNQNFWEVRQLPRSIVFLGGGVISVELGQALARFGSAVTLIDRNRRILKAVDEDVSALAAEALQQEGVQILTNTEVVNCRQLQPGQISLSLVQNGQPQELLAEQIFVALGRTPNTAGLQLEQAGVAYSDRGVTVNQFLQTTTPNIYACGDVASSAKFTHMAAYQAEICIANILGGNTVESDLSIVPWAIFMEPEIGHVGLTEAEARRQYTEVAVSAVKADSIDRFITESQTAGFLKIVLGHNNVILGADAIGEQAGEWIQLLTLALKQKLTLPALADMIVIYPTFSEIVKKAATRYLRTQPAA